jgi:hypothetical protein
MERFFIKKSKKNKEYYQQMFYYACDYITDNDLNSDDINLLILAVILRILKVIDITNDDVFEIINKMYNKTLFNYDDKFDYELEYVKNYSNYYIKRKIRIEKLNKLKKLIN